MEIMSPEDKAAVLLKCLPPEKTEGLLARLRSEHRERLRDHMNHLGQEPHLQRILEQVLRDFEEQLQQQPIQSPAAALQDSVELSAKAPPPETQPEAAPAVPIEVPKPPEVPKAPSLNDAVGMLHLLEAAHLAAALEEEQPRTVALVLDTLETNQAGEVLKRLPSELRREVSPRLGQGTTVSPRLLPRIAQAIVQKCQVLREKPKRPTDEAKFRKMADMLRLLDQKARTEMLTALEGSDVETANRVREYLYRFEDILVIEDRSIQKLLAEIDSKSLATAIKGASEQISEKILANLSKRARETLTEEMEFLGTLPAAQIQQAQKLVADAIQHLDEAGELVMKE